MDSPHSSTYSSQIQDVKCVVLGDAGVGKTCIMSRFLNDIFEEQPKSTTGPQFDKKVIQVNSQKIRLKLWDTAGQERFRALSQMCYRDANIIIFVFDVTAPESLHDLVYWIDLVDANSDPRAIRAIVANKTDLERAISPDDGKRFALDRNMSYFECNAKTGAGVEKVFVQLASKKLGSSLNNSCITEPEVSRIDKTKETKKTLCC